MARRNNAIEDQKTILKNLFASGKPYSVIYMGVSGLHEYMEEFGEDLAPRLVDVISRRVQRCVRGGDCAIAMADDQYALVINGVYDVEVMNSLQSRIRSSVEEDLVLENHTASLQVEFGFAAFPGDGENFTEVMERAKMALERSRRSRSRFDSHSQSVKEALESAGEPVHALRVDTLTGLPGSQFFRDQSEKLVEAAGPAVERMVVVFCDIEKFKEYNLKFGYSSGDDLLQFMADSLLEVFPGDLVARLNSDRFGVLTSSDGLEEKLKEVHDKIRLFKINSSVEFKAGICALADCEYSTTMAQDYARLACDSIKGRFDQVWRRFDDKLAGEVRRRQYIVDNLDLAIENGWIEVYYQPIIRAVTGKVCGMEALARWNDPEFGMLPPGEFIDILEDAHLIHKLDLCVARQVCEAGRELIDKGGKVMSRSLNFSRLDYQLCDVFALVDGIVEETGFPKDKLHIEFTETAFTQDAEFFTGVIERFRDAGYAVWMDDFGSGYSSLNLLKDYNFDVLKIDMGFLRGLETSVRTRDIVTSVVDMAKKLGIQTLAEGVENHQQYLFLKSIGCELLQGFLFSKPVPLDEVTRMIDAGELDAECDDDAAYYTAIGQVNMLSPSPFDQLDDREHELAFSSGIPLAIIERRGLEATIVVANEAFMDAAIDTEVISSTGDDTIEFNSRGEKLARSIVDLSDQAKGSGEVESLDFYNFKELFTLRLLHLVEKDDRDAYLVSLNKYETVSDQARNQPMRDKSSDLVYLPERQVTPWQQSDDLDLNKTAVVVIDVLGGTEGVTPGLEEMAANSVAIVKAARAAGMPIIFNNDSHIKGLDQELDLWGDHGVRGTASGTTLAEFDVQESDFIIPKRRYNGFFETDLELTLRELGVTTLIMVGADTNICVLQTLAGAYFYGYKTVVPSDATATFLIGTQEAGLEYFSRCYDTRIVTTHDILKRIGSNEGSADTATE